MSSQPELGEGTSGPVELSSQAELREGTSGPAELSSQPELREGTSGPAELSSQPELREGTSDPNELMELMATLRAYMSTKGLKWTDQRRLIAEVFFRAKRHLSIEELLALARAVDSHVGYATVYRTLKLLADCGVATERMFQDGLKRYEVSLGDEHHDHLICVACGAIEEFSDPRIEELQRDVATRHGFQLTSHKHEMYGVCPTCVAAGNAAG